MGPHLKAQSLQNNYTLPPVGILATMDRPSLDEQFEANGIELFLFIGSQPNFITSSSVA